MNIVMIDFHLEKQKQKYYTFMVTRAYYWWNIIKKKSFQKCTFLSLGFVKLFGEYSDFIALQKFLRHNFTKVQVPWVKILTLKMPLGVLFNFCQKDQNSSALFTFYFVQNQNKPPFSGPFFNKIWSKAKEHFPSQYFNSRDLTFKNLASKFSKWLKISILMHALSFCRPKIILEQSILFWTG